MGPVHAEIKIANSDDLALSRRGQLPPDQVREMQITMLVDSGAYMMGINEEIRAQLGLPKVEERLAEYADGSLHSLEVVGPVEMRFSNRRTVAYAMVLPGNSEPLLGSIPMEDMDLLIEPKTQRVIINPTMPYISKKPMK